MNNIVLIAKQFIRRLSSNLSRTSSCNESQLRQSLLDIAVEEYRMRDVIISILSKLNPVETPRFENRYRYFCKEVEKALSNSGFRILDTDNFIGKPFDTGMAVKPLNIKSFDSSDELIIQQVIEPVIMEGENVARIGVVKLRRAY